MAAKGVAAARNLADEIESRRALIIDAYKTQLTSADNAVTHDPEAFGGTIAYIDQLLSELAGGLRGGKPVDEQDCRDTSGGETIEGRTKSGVDPRASFEATSILFDSVVAAITDIIPPGATAAATFGEAVTLLERSITARTRNYFLTYLAHLAEKIHQARSDERRRIARDLHDRIGHGLSATQLQLELYDLYRDSDPTAAAVKVDTARQAVQESIHNLRSITSDLHTHEPVTSLALALMSYVESAAVHDADVSVRVNGNESRVPADMRDESFLILREALRNAMRHAKASKVVVDVAVTRTELVASVADDGVGFEVKEPPGAGGMGLTAMTERAELLGGALTVSSTSGHGTTVRFHLPLGAAGA
jgi:signal transduction histidine kinase